MNELKIPTNLETISLNEQTNYRLIEISKIKDYFDQEIKDQELLIRKLGKYITGFHYTDKIVTVFLTIFSGANIFSHVKKRKHAGLIISVFSLFFCFSAGIIKKLLYETKKRKKKHNKLLYLRKNKLDCIEMLISQAITDRIIDEKKDYDSQKK